MANARDPSGATMTVTTDETRLSRGDRLTMYFTIALGGVATGIVLWDAVARLLEVIPGRDVPVVVRFVGEPADLAIGQGGAAVDATVSQALVTVPQPAAATQFALVAEPIVHALAIIAGILLLGRFCWNLARGRVFARGTVRLVWWGAGVLTAGWFVGGILTKMTMNGALSAISRYEYEPDVSTVGTDWVPIFGLLALAAIGAAFQIGEKLQRETEGLV
jgi:hypothetical protein